MTKLSQRQTLVSIKDLPGLWASKSGGNITADASPVWDGGSVTPEMMAGPASAENITTGRPFDDQRDLPLLGVLRSRVGKWRTTITVQYTNADLVPIGVPTVYPDALLVSCNEPEADASSSDSMMLELEWAIGAYV